MGNNAGKLGWLMGMVLGTMLGVLYAPQKGKELRAKINADRKKGKLGIAPLQEDFKVLGKEFADLAKDMYKSDAVKNLVEMGRKKVQGMSDDWVDDVHDFHKTRIVPFQKEMMAHLGKLQDTLKKGKKTVKKADGELGAIKGKIKKSVKIGKKAVKAIGKTMKKK